MAATFRCAALPAGFGICFTMVLSECRSPRFLMAAGQADSSLVIGLVDPAAVIEHCSPKLLTSGTETSMPAIGCLHTPSLLRIDSDQRTSCWMSRRALAWVIVARTIPLKEAQQVNEAEDFAGSEDDLQFAAAAGALPLDLLLSEAALGVAHRFRPRTASVRWGMGLVKHPRTVAGKLGGLTAEGARIALGSSQIRPDKHDRRFSDSDWETNPILKRVLQSYLAAGRTAGELLEGAELSYEDHERVEFLVRNVTEALAPSNNPLVNPTARKAFTKSRGRSAVRGTRNLVEDMRHAPRIPTMVDPDSFEVGKDLAITPGEVVFRDEMFELIQYYPTTKTVVDYPVVVVPPVINKYYAIDLAPGKSMVEYLVGRGQQPFVISWRNPSAEHRSWGFDAYGAAIIRAMEVARAISGADKVNLYSICSGGIIAAMVLSHLQATDQLAGVSGFAMAVTVLDQAAAGLASAALTEEVAQLAIAMSASRGYLDGRNLAEAFAWLRPTDLIWNYWVNNYLAGRTPPKFDVLFWNADTTRMAAELHKDFVETGLHNGLVSAGGTTMLGTGVDLSALDLDSFVVAGVADHICPWEAVYATTQVMGGEQTFVLSTSGHVAALINPPGNPKARYRTGRPYPPNAAEWLEQASTNEGSWWPEFSDWLAERGGGERPAPPELGNDEFPPICPAPGSYVRAG